MDDQDGVRTDGKMDVGTSMRCAMNAVESILRVDDDRPSLVSRIAIELGAEIIEGVRAPGADLNSVELSRRYATSRTPVREALLLLESEGIVTITPRRRPRVSEFDSAAMRDVYRTRCALLEFIASDVARYATEEDIAALSDIGEQMRRAQLAQDFSAYLWANVSFHALNTVLSRNRIVKQIIDSLLLRTLPLRRLSLSRADAMEQSLDDHLHLIRAYRDRDPNLAAALQRSNHMRSLRRLEGMLAERSRGAGGGGGWAAGVRPLDRPSVDTPALL